METDRTATVAEAAKHLGISTDAVRKRLTRGTIVGEKVDGEWRVTLPDDVPDDSTPPSETATGQGAPRDAQDLRDTIEDLRARLDWSQGEMSELRVEASRARERADTLQALNIQHRDRIRELEALTATIEDDSGENEATASPVSADTDATYTGSHVIEEEPPVTGWQRFKRWLRDG